MWIQKHMFPLATTILRGTEANLTTEVNQSHNSFLSGALISLEPEAPTGN